MSTLREKGPGRRRMPAGQAICTKYVGPTNSHGARIKVSAQAGTMYVPWDYALDTFANHEAAAYAYAAKKGWSGDWVGGGLPRDDGYCFVSVT